MAKRRARNELPLIEVLPGYPGRVMLRVTYSGWPDSRSDCPIDGPGLDSEASDAPAKGIEASEAKTANKELLSHE